MNVAFASVYSLKNKIDNKLQEALDELEGEVSQLKSSCYYAIGTGGKRLRPILVELVANALNNSSDVTKAALATEFFHTASLIADDLPCMDNEDKRRGKLSLHKAFNESTSLLASYTFISLGYEYIRKNIVTLQKQNLSFSNEAFERGFLALELVAGSAGILGATYGQFLDLFPPNQKLETLEKIIEKKTITLFDISFSLGWLFGGGSIALLPKVKEAAYLFGMAFQILDDLNDIEEDDSFKNIAAVLGKEKALFLLKEKKELLIQKLQELGIYSETFAFLIQKAL